MKKNTISTDLIFSDNRLVKIYDDFDPDRSDLDPYIQMLKEVNAHHVIDLGCGTGSLALLLSKEGIQVLGVDPAKASIEIAKSKQGAERIKWLVGDASVLPVNFADAVVMTGNVAQAIIEPKQWSEALKHIYSSLNPDGHLIFETRNPNFKAWEEWTKEQSFKSVNIKGVGQVDGWVELQEVNLPLVSFRWTYFFHQDNTTLISDSTLRFRTISELTNDLEYSGFKVSEIIEAPDRPGKEFVVKAQKSNIQM